ncbi:MAG TPA: type II secretion system F family protein [Acetobacteraceae bacterium]|nr:type II secretion system F family protein [Acetobacteraceae bacterium]
MTLDLVLWLAMIACVTMTMVLIAREVQSRALNMRVTSAVLGAPGQSGRLHTLTEWLARAGQRYRRYYHPENLEHLRMMVQTSGFNPHRMVPVVIGGKMLSMALFPAVAMALTIGVPWSSRLILLLMAIVAGIMVPRLLLQWVRHRFNSAIQRGTADAIDLLVVCSEAGMGLESGIERVAQEMARTNPPLSQVLHGLLNDLQVLPNRRDAFLNLANRSTCEGLRRFGTMINQSLQYGTPLGTALRAIADELRRDRITRLEERAHKLGAKLIIPMVLFMLPAMFIVLAGSPALHLMQSLHSLK